MNQRPKLSSRKSFDCLVLIVFLALLFLFHLIFLTSTSKCVCPLGDAVICWRCVLFSLWTISDIISTVVIIISINLYQFEFTADKWVSIVCFYISISPYRDFSQYQLFFVYFSTGFFTFPFCGLVIFWHFDQLLWSHEAVFAVFFSN